MWVVDFGWMKKKTYQGYFKFNVIFKTLWRKIDPKRLGKQIGKLRTAEIELSSKQSEII